MLEKVGMGSKICRNKLIMSELNIRTRGENTRRLFSYNKHMSEQWQR